MKCLRSARGWLLLLGGLTAPFFGAAEAAPSIGFVVTSWTTAIYQTRFMDECPVGLNPGNDEYWWRGLSPVERGRLTENGLITQVERMGRANIRGPHGEDVCWNPTAVKDPPLLTVEGDLSYGANLDGTLDGHATATSCAHPKFTGLDGQVGVDNQLYRLLGCIYGWRNYGHIDINANGQRLISGLGMIAIEIRGAEGVQDAPYVEVAFYRSVDPFALDSAGKVIPFGTYTIDADKSGPRYGDVVHGRIVKGVLTTEPADITLPFYGNYHYAQNHLRGAVLRLELNGDGGAAKGFLAGYYDVDALMSYVTTLGGSFSATAQFSCPAIYEAAHRLADGYPDPKTGQCAALSSAFLIEASAAFLNHPDMPDARHADNAP
jgi:hypothetical protein